MLSINTDNLEKHKSGLWVRPDTYDSEIIAEMPRAYGHMDFEDKRVLDVGANIGAFACYAFERGAREVWSFEPAPDNFELLRLNSPSAHKFNAALIHGNHTTIPFYISRTGKNPGNYSAIVTAGRKEIIVNAINFGFVLNTFKFQVIKLDVEGSEYDLLRTPLTESVEEITMELHLNRKKWRQILAPAVLDMFSDWEVTKQPRITNKNWQTIAGFKRLPQSKSRPLQTGEFFQ